MHLTKPVALIATSIALIGLMAVAVIPFVSGQEKEVRQNPKFAESKNQELAKAEKKETDIQKQARA